MISRTSAYALEAVLAIAARETDGLVRAVELAEVLDQPPNYLSKILNALARAGILHSERGPTGGFGLAERPEDIAIEDIVGQFEDLGPGRRCFLGRDECSDRDSCPLHDDWKRVSAPMFEFFRETTLADLLATRSPARKRPRPRPRRPARRK